MNKKIQSPITHFTTGTFTINPAPLTVTASNETKVYDGTSATDPALAFTYVGLTNGDASANFTGSLTRTPGENVGTYPITQGTLTATGNYTIFTVIPGAFTITPASNTIGFPTPNSVVYGAPAFSISGDANATSGAPVSYTILSGPGSLNGTTLTVTGAGTIVIEATQAANGNYQSAASVIQTLTVTPASLTVMATSMSKTYGQADPNLTFTYTGLVNGDTAANFIGGLTRAAGESVAGYTISQGTLAAIGNYTIGTFNSGSLTINPALLKVTANNTSKVYGTTLSFAGSEFTTTGLVNGDTVTSVTLTSSGTAATATVAGSPYTITASNAVGTGLGNYTTIYVAGNLTVTPAPLTIFADSTSKTYGTTLTFAGTEFTTNGLVNTDAVSTVTLASSGAAATATVTGSPYAITASNAVGSGLGNYTITYDSGSVTVNKALLTVTANSTSKTYGQTLTFAGTEFTTNGLVNGDSVILVSLSSPGAAATAVVSGSTYPITASAALGSGLGNYTITYDSGALTVTPASLTITANNTTKTYGTALTFAGTEFTTSGLVNGDAVTSVTLTSSGAAQFAPVAGSPYAITASAGVGSGLSNYSITHDAGSLTINQASDAITFNALPSETYSPSLTITLGATGLSSSPIAYTVLSGPGSVVGGTLSVSAGGTIVIEANQAGDGNFTAAAPVIQALTVTPASQLIGLLVPPPTVTFGTAPIALTTLGATATSGLAVSYTVISGPGFISGNFLNVTGGGSIVIEVDQAGNADYSAAPSVDQTLTVNPASQSITFPAIPAITYGSPPIPLIDLGATASSGLAVSYSIVSGPAIISGTNLIATGTGSVVIQASQGGNANYAAATPAQQTLTVADFTQTITFAQPAAVTFGVAPITLSATASSKLAVSFTVLQGPGTISGSKLTVTGAGNIIVEATQGGNGIYAPAVPVVRTLVVNKKADAITFAALTAVTYSPSLTVTLHATGGGSSSPVVFSVVSGPGTVVGNVLTVTGAGSIVIQANQAADANYNAAAPVSRTLVVNKANQTIAFAAFTAVAYTTAPITLGATASSGLTVTYSVVSGPGSIVSGNQLHITGVGSIVVKASHAGNANYNAAVAISRTLVVNKAAQTINFPAFAGPVTTSASPLPLTATASSGLTVTYAVISGPGTINGDVLTFTNTGTIVIKASQAGNADFTAATPVEETLTVA